MDRRQDKPWRDAGNKDPKPGPPLGDLMADYSMVRSTQEDCTPNTDDGRFEKSKGAELRIQPLLYRVGIVGSLMLKASE